MPRRKGDFDGQLIITEYTIEKEKKKPIEKIIRLLKKDLTGSEDYKMGIRKAILIAQQVKHSV